ncbi:Heat shock protein 40 like protein [Ectocarpus siliculosus]|uniref:Heat shock protein 40 like protein n=1 Tax=Ectocarpus siliculosus TaxID=2880 RepID=D7FU93_ECTSI|nr:Heat shock protein 40 like protein [Ectocarpus siliculosus]|eukprot:CBJ31620.1 Heat shock protein 40 like protein [Ectocarpus siliculosus]
MNMWRLNWIHSTVLCLAILGKIRVASTQDNEIEVTLTRGTTGLGIHLVSESKTGSLLRGAVVDRVVPESAASFVLLKGDILTTVAGVEIRQWALDNINRLLETQVRVKIKLVRAPQLGEIGFGPEEGEGGRAESASCYASIEGDVDDLHAFACTPAAFGSDLPAFSLESSALPIVVAQPLDHCKRSSFDASGSALLVSKGGCLPGAKAANAAWNGAEVMILVDGQYPPLPPLPSVAGKRVLPQSSRDTSKLHGIPVVIVSNATGYRMISEVRERGREVLTFAHSGPHPSRPATKPRKQIPVDEAESLRVREHPFNLRSLFRDGEIGIEFGSPGLPKGQTPTTHLAVSCELSTLLTGLQRRVPFGRTVPCPVCNGRGAPAEAMRPCKACSSSGEPGVAAAAHDHSHEVKQSLRTTCPRCHGFGEVPQWGRSCQRCKGERVIQESGWLDLTIPKGAPDQHRIHFPGVGSHFPGRTAGDVEVAINIEPHERFMRDGSNLRMELPISLTEALSGFTREIQLLNGSTVLLNRTRMISHNGEVEIEGGGLPVWDGGRGAGTGWSTHSSTNASALLADKTVTGSTIVTCSVEFPDITSERLQGLDSAGAASDE